jgi:pimeloyl-ACP methyl ester carboxylesterase
VKSYLTDRFSSSSGEILYGQVGQGQDVVLVHGTPTSSVIWNGVVSRLKERFCFHILDLPGYGGSERSVGQDLRLRALASVLAEWLDYKRLNPIVVGHDFGAAAVLGAHLVEGASVEAICVADGVALSPWGTKFSRHVKTHEDVFAAVPEYVHEAMLRAHLSTAFSRTPPVGVMEALIDPWVGEAGQRAYYRNIGQFDYAYTDELEELYSLVSVPTLVLWGEEDRWVGVNEGRRLCSLIPGAELRTLPDAGHFSMLDTPGLFTLYLDSWLSRLDPQ